MLAEVLGDQGAKEKLAGSALRQRDAARQFADELRQADEAHRRWKIDSRLRTLDERVLDMPKGGLVFQQSDHGNRLVLNGKANDEKAVMRAMTLMFRLLYVDRQAHAS